MTASTGFLASVNARLPIQHQRSNPKDDLSCVIEKQTQNIPLSRDTGAERGRGGEGSQLPSLTWTNRTRMVSGHTSLFHFRSGSADRENMIPATENPKLYSKYSPSLFYVWRRLESSFTCFARPLPGIPRFYLLSAFPAHSTSLSPPTRLLLEN